MSASSHRTRSWRERRAGIGEGDVGGVSIVLMDAEDAGLAIAKGR